VRAVNAVQCGERPRFSLRFEPLVEGEAVIEVPCDACGQVDLDALAEAERNAYFYARTVRHGRFAVRVVPLNNC
jgi:hypothetical protein